LSFCPQGEPAAKPSLSRPVNASGSSSDLHRYVVGGARDGVLVVAEAMASGLACLVTARFRYKLEALAMDRDLRSRLGAAAVDRIRRSLTWDSKAKRIHEVYRWVLGHRSDKPDLELVISYYSGLHTTCAQVGGDVH